MSLPPLPERLYLAVNRKGLHSRLCKFWPPSLVLKLTSSGPTVEKGLAALDSLYDLRNVIPGLISSSKMEDQEGDFNQARPTDKLTTSLERVLAASSIGTIETVYQCQPPNPPTRNHLPPASPPLHAFVAISIDSTDFRPGLVPYHGPIAQVARSSIGRNKITNSWTVVQGVFGGCY